MVLVSHLMFVVLVFRASRLTLSVLRVPEADTVLGVSYLEGL